MRHETSIKVWGYTVGGIIATVLCFCGAPAAAFGLMVAIYFAV